MSHYDCELSEAEIIDMFQGNTQALLDSEAEYERFERFGAFEGDAKFFAEIACRREYAEQGELQS